MLMNNDFDDIDRQLLALIQTDARRPLDQIAHIVGVSTATVQRRLRQLRESGVFEREVAILNPKASGFPMSFIVMVELERESTQHLDAFKKVLRKEPQVQQAYYVTGEADFALICMARDMDDFELLTRRLFMDRPNVRRFRSSAVMQRTKVSLDLPIE